MTVEKVKQDLESMSGVKIHYADIARALKKNLSNICAKAKRETELRFSEVEALEKYFGYPLMPNRIRAGEKSQLSVEG